jgi:hypothetical protein
MLVLSVQLRKLGTLEDMFDDLHEVDSKDLELFYEMEALGQFYLTLDGSPDCHANLFLPNKRRLVQMQTTVMAHPHLTRVCYHLILQSHGTLTWFTSLD